MKSVIGITGSPGTGKKTIGKIIACLLDYKFIDINKLAFNKKCILKNDRHGAIIDTKNLKMHIKRELKDGRTIVSGHLLPYVTLKKDIDFVVVLRCSPNELLKRYSHRNYDEKKIEDNTFSEILDICLNDAINKFGSDKITEVESTSKEPLELAEIIVKLFRKELPKEIGLINWLSQTNGLKLQN